MDKKRFKQITTEILLEYGFVKSDKKFYLHLPEMIIEFHYLSFRGIKYFHYAFSINALDNLSDPPENLLTGRYDSLTYIKLQHSPLLEGYHSHEILFEEYSEEYYRSLFEKTIHIHFDAYKTDAFQHIKTHMNWQTALSKNVREFLNIPFRGDYYQITKGMFEWVKQKIEKEYSDNEKDSHPYLAEEVIWHALTAKKFVEILQEYNLSSPINILKMSVACEGLADILRNHPDLLTYEAMKESKVWKKALLLVKEALKCFR